MKFRTDYVTNSSSSSYTCEVCGRTESGYDIGLSECEMYECENGHIFCTYEALKADSKEIIKIIMENEYNIGYNNKNRENYSEGELYGLENERLIDLVTEGGYFGVPECMCPICSFIEYSENDLSSYLLKKYKISRDEVFAEIKSLNKRRKKLYESEYITYVCRKFNLNPAGIVAGWKDEFGTYENMKQKMKNAK